MFAQKNSSVKNQSSALLLVVLAGLSKKKMNDVRINFVGLEMGWKGSSLAGKAGRRLLHSILLVETSNL